MNGGRRLWEKGGAYQLLQVVPAYGCTYAGCAYICRLCLQVPICRSQEAPPATRSAQAPGWTPMKAPPRLPTQPNQSTPAAAYTHPACCARPNGCLQTHGPIGTLTHPVCDARPHGCPQTHALLARQHDARPRVVPLDEGPGHVAGGQRRRRRRVGRVRRWARLPVLLLLLPQSGLSLQLLRLALQARGCGQGRLFTFLVALSAYFC